MKISIIDEISKLDETFIESLCWETANEVSVSDFEIKRKVRKRLRQKYRIPSKRLKLAAICCFVILISIPVCAGMILKLDVSTQVNKNNEKFIGTEVNDDYHIIYNNGKYVDSNGVVLSEEDLMETKDALANNRIVNKLQESVVCPGSFVEIMRINHKGKTSAYPKIILVNDSVCILTKEDGTGWKMSEGDNLCYDFSKIPSEVIDEQNLIVGYIKDGMLCEGESFREKAGQFSLKIKDPGIYYIYLRSGSSDYLTLEESLLSIERKD